MLFKNILLLAILYFIPLVHSDLVAQVTGIKYKLKYNTDTELMDCYLVITEGSATEMKQRVQFNSQISLVAPKGTVPEIKNTYMPINDNQKYTGTQPCKWKIMSVVISPAISQEYIYFSIVPDLKVSSFYNNLQKGDVVKLFSIGMQNDNVCVNAIRLFENDKDPMSSDTGMKGADFTNSFTLGSIQSIYKGNIQNEKVLNISRKGKKLLITGPGDTFEWYSTKDNKMIVSTKEREFVPEINGQFYVKSINKNCSILSDIISYKGRKQ